MVRLSILEVTGEADAGRQVRLDDAGDDVDRRALRRHDQVDAGRARLLREALDQELDFLAGGHHQVGELVDDHHDLRQDLVFELLHLVFRLAGLLVVAGLHAAAERLALGLGLAHLGVEAGELAHADRRHHPVALLHLLDRPFERADRLGGLGHDGREEVRDVVVDAELQHLGIDHDHPALLGRQPVEQRQDHAVEADRLARAGGAGDEQVRHRREIGDDRIAGDVLAQDQRQRGDLVLEGVAGDQLGQDHHLALGVGKLDADHAAAGDGRDAGRQRRHVAGDVVGELDDAARLDAARGLQLVHGDDRAGADLDDLALDRKVLEHRFEQARVALQRRLVERAVARRRRRA
jgi:hypothetical protein